MICKSFTLYVAVSIMRGFQTHELETRRCLLATSSGHNCLKVERRFRSSQVFALEVGVFKNLLSRWPLIEQIRTFEEFLAALGPRPSVKHEVDRRNTDGHYEPGNIRWATRSQQVANQRKRPGCTSRFKGVHLSPKRRWIARITVNGNVISLGSFGNEILAARRYDEAAVEHFREFACPNFPAGFVA